MDYTAIAEKALEKIKQSGKAMTITRPSADGVYAPEKGEFDYGAIDTDYPCYGLIQAPNREGRGDRFYDGTIIQAGDMYILLAASGLSITPRAGDLIEGYSIVASQPIAPGGVNLLYRILARK